MTDRRAAIVEVPGVQVDRRCGGGPLTPDHDEGVRADAGMDALTRLRPIMQDGVVTAGSASQQNDAAAACLLVAEDKLAELGLEPLGCSSAGRSRAAIPPPWASAPCPPWSGRSPAPGWAGTRLDLVELNEAFACLVLAVLKGWRWHEPDQLNVNGSGISLGHPIGATGARILTTVLHELKRRGGRYALETLGIGGGQGIAALLEAA